MYSLDILDASTFASVAECFGERVALQCRVAALLPVAPTDARLASILVHTRFELAALDRPALH